MRVEQAVKVVQGDQEGVVKIRPEGGKKYFCAPEYFTLAVALALFLLIIWWMVRLPGS